MGGAASEGVVIAAYQTGLGVVAISLLLLAEVFVLRAFFAAREERRRRVLDEWRPLFVQAMVEMPDRVPAAPRRDAATLLGLFNHYHQTLRGDATESLNRFGRAAGLDEAALALLRHKSLSSRMIATAALGHFRERRAWDDLLRLAQGSYPALSLAAARSLMQIDAGDALPALLPLIMARGDWPAARVAVILTQAGPDAISQPLADAAIQAPPAIAARLVRYLAAAHHDVAARALRQILATTEDEQLIASCLHILNDPRDLEMARRYLHHSSWHVRLQAASALGRMGAPADTEGLVGLLSDPEWWVRLRAAQALAGLPFLSTGELRSLQASQPDENARAVLEHAIMERRPA